MSNGINPRKTKINQLESNLSVRKSTKNKPIKSMKKLLLPMFLLSISGLSNAQQSNINKTNFPSIRFAEVQTPTIEVNGENEFEIAPNEIVVHFTLMDRYEGKKKITIAEQEQNLKESLKKLGIPNNKLTLQDASSSLAVIKRKNKDVISTKNFEITLNNAPIVSKLFEQFDEIDIQMAYIHKLNHTQLDSFKNVARIAAVKNAKMKAKSMVEATGSKLGMPLMINESQIYASTMENDDYMYKNRMFAVADSVESNLAESKPLSEEIEIRKITIKSTVFVRYLILEKDNGNPRED
jgi:hypothetical protein